MVSLATDFLMYYKSDIQTHVEDKRKYKATFKHKWMITCLESSTPNTEMHFLFYTMKKNNYDTWLLLSKWWPWKAHIGTQMSQLSIHPNQFLNMINSGVFQDNKFSNVRQFFLV